MTEKESVILWCLTAGSVIAVVLLSCRLYRVRKFYEQRCDNLNRDLEKRDREYLERWRRVKSSLSHGIRMPMSIAMGYSELIVNGFAAGSEEQNVYVLKICEQLTYLNDYLKKVLEEDLWRPAVEEGRLSKKEVDITSLLQSMTDNGMRAAAARQGISILLSFSRSPICVEADEIMLRKVFYNLLENSLKYMGREGRITVEVCLEDGWCRLIWRDDGKGLPSGEAGNIFEGGYRGTNSTQGAGAGLALVRQIIVLHGGTVGAECGEDSGLAVWLRLPCRGKAGHELGGKK